MGKKYDKTYAERAAAYKAKTKNAPAPPPADPLSPDERRRRALKAMMNSPVAPGSDTTMRDIARERKNAIGLEFAPAEKTIADQRATEAGRQQAIGTWFDDYKKTLEGLRASEQGRSDQVNAQVKALGEGSASLAAADASRVAAEMTNDAQARGATADTRLTDQATQAARANQALNANFGSLLASQALASDSYAAGRIGTTKQAEVEARIRELGNLGKIDANALDLARQKGMASSKYTSDAVQRERQYGLSLQHQKAEDKAVGVKSQQEDAALRVSLIKAGINPDTMQYDASLKPPKTWSASEKKAAADLKFFNEHGYYPPTGPPKKPSDTKDKPTSGPGSLTASEEQKRISKVRTVSSYFSRGLPVVDPKTGRVKKTINDQDEIRQYLLTVKGIDPLAVRIGEILSENHGKLTPKGIRAARRYGVHVKGNFGRVKPAPTGVDAIPGVGPAS